MGACVNSAISLENGVINAARPIRQEQCSTISAGRDVSQSVTTVQILIKKYDIDLTGDMSCIAHNAAGRLKKTPDSALSAEHPCIHQAVCSRRLKVNL